MVIDFKVYTKIIVYEFGRGEICVAGFMNNIGNSFYTKDISGEYTLAQPENCARDIVSKLPESNRSFMVLHTFQGRRFAFGYITSNHLFGYIRILEYDGHNAEYLINNGVYNKVGE